MCFRPLFPKYGNSGPDHNFFSEMLLNIKFHNRLIDMLRKSPRSPANFASNSISHQFSDFAVQTGKVEQWILRYFCGISNSFLRKHSRDFIFSLQLLNMITTKKYYGDFWKVEKFQNGGLFCPIFLKKHLMTLMSKYEKSGPDTQYFFTNFVH